MEDDVLKDWHEAALKYFRQGLKKKEVSDRIEAEFGLTNMFDAVRQYLYRQSKKEEKPSKPEKRVVVQSLLERLSSVFGT